MNPDIFLVGSHGDDFEYVERERLRLKEKGKSAGWWSFSLNGDRKKLLEHWPYLYAYHRAPRQKVVYRYHIAEYQTDPGNSGIECPWPEFQDDEMRGESRFGEKRSDICKTWFLYDEITVLEKPLLLEDFLDQSGKQVSPSSLLSTFGYWQLRPTKLVWKRADEIGFDLVLINPDDIHIDEIRETLKSMANPVDYKMRLNPVAAKEFSRWLKNPGTPLDGKAYSTLNAWFQGSEGTYKSGKSLFKAQRFWNLLFAVQPKIRLTKPGDHFNIIPAEFNAWWSEMERLQGNPGNYWIFQANPKIYNIREGIKNRDIGLYSVTRYKDQIKKGDFIFLWESGPKGGVVGTASLPDDPKLRRDLIAVEEYDREEKEKNPNDTAVRIDVLSQVDPPLGKDLIRKTPGLEGLSVLKNPQGTNFSVTRSEAAILRELINPAPKPSIWLVNQETTYETEKEKGLLWLAADRDSDGSGFKLMAEVNRGDLVINYSKGSIRALSLVSQPAEEGLDGDLIEIEDVEVEESEIDRAEVKGNGFVVGTEYHELADPVQFKEIPQELAKSIGKYFDEKGRIEGGYFFSVDPDAASRLITRFRERFPSLPVLEKVTGKTTGKVNPFSTILDNLKEKGIFFPVELVANYLLSLQAKRFVILTGISGTGKTKIATAITDFFIATIKEKVTTEIPEDSVEISAKPYMFKYKRVVVPVALLSQYPLSAFEEAGEDKTIQTFYPGGEQRLKYWRDPSTHVTQILFKGKFWEWFEQNITEKDNFILKGPNPDSEEKLSILFDLPEKQEKEILLENSEVVAVRPDWTDNRGLLGYYNPITNKYSATPFLKLLLRAHEELARAKQQDREPHPFFVVLDEMNLARVEHYFSDFLSCLESGKPIHLHDDIALEQGETEEDPVPCRLKIPSNLFFTGTVNVDETTYMFSPKILDRAFTIEFNQVNLRAMTDRQLDDRGTPLKLNKMPGVLKQLNNPDSEDWNRFGKLDNGRLQETVISLNDLLATEHRHFGYRVAVEIARFVNLADEQAGKSEAVLKAALDLALLEKVLPKFHGTQQELEEILLRMFEFAVRGKASANVGSLENLTGTWVIENGKLCRRKEAFATLGDASESDENQGVSAADIGTAEMNLDPEFPRTAAKLFHMLMNLQKQGFTSFIE